jgi:uncharacterized protein with PIN domain
MKFICDDNLGKLASYLRMLGFDTWFEDQIDDNILLKTASAQKRLLITRDSKLIHKIHPYGVLLVEYDDPLEQLKKVVVSQSLTIDPSELFNRCSKCNEICLAVDKDQVADKVFPYILKTQDVIKRCPSCKRFYWQGSHYKNVLKKLIFAIPRDALAGDWPEF